jgi:hypothetical protein
MHPTAVRLYALIKWQAINLEFVVAHFTCHHRGGEKWPQTFTCDHKGGKNETRTLAFDHRSGTKFL